MCGGGGGGGGGDNSQSLAMQRESLDLSKEQFAETKRQWSQSFSWQQQKAAEQKAAAVARPGKGPIRTTDYAASALGDRSALGFGKDRLTRGVTGKGLAIV